MNSPRYRRHPAPPIPSDAFRLLSRLAEEEGVNLQAVIESADAQSILTSIIEQTKTPIRLHGKRIEEMFVYVVLALRAVRAIKREETEDLVVTSTADVLVPDFRLVLPDQAEILVEVKNINERSPSRRRALKPEYLKRLSAYGDLFSRPVYLAAYWAPWRIWTLHPVNELLAAAEADALHFSFIEAYPRSHMRLLGDAQIATKHPLAFKMDVTSQVLRSQGATSEQMITVDTAKLYVAGKRIRRQRDRTIALGFMFHGQWEETQQLTMDGDRVATISFLYSPADPDEGQPFAIVGSLSSFASSEFNGLTAAAGSVQRLRPRNLPRPPYPFLGEEYYGEDLPLWLFLLQPAEVWQ